MKLRFLGLNGEGWCLFGILNAVCSPLLYFHPALFLTPFAASVGLLWFYRDPARISATAPDDILSPSDGRVAVVSAPESDPEAESDAGTSIVLHLRLDDIHVVRAPRAATLVSARRIGGAHIRAAHPDAGRKNARLELTFRADDRSFITVVPAVGFVARRIVSWILPGDCVRAGERIGLIRFGSRVEIFLPRGYRTCVAPGDRVTGGITVVATRQEKAHEHPS